MVWKPSYADLPQMRDWLRLRDASDTVDDALLTLAISASSRAVDKACGPNRQFGKADEVVTRSYPLRWSRTLDAYLADIDDLYDPTGMTVTVYPQADASDTTIIDSGRVSVYPRNAVADGMVYTDLVIRGDVGGGGFDVSVASDKWGWQAIPDPVVEATMLQTSRLNIRRDSPYGIAGGPDSGTELRLLERLDPDIAPIVAGYVRTGWVAR